MARSRPFARVRPKRSPGITRARHLFPPEQPVLIPYSTDAPLYHLPIATVAMILINTLVFAWELSVDEETIVHFALWWGEGLYPWQWLTCNFLHAGVLHLVGNMIFLWVFGLIVEGKLGWWRFSLCYVGIGVVHAALEQALSLLFYDEGKSLGASGAIFGLMGMALVWAPKNHIDTLVWYLIPRVVEIPVMIFAGLQIGMELFVTLVSGFALSSSLLHMFGAVVGTPLGFFLLVRGQVDCEGWDLINVWRGDVGASNLEHREPPKPETPETRQRAGDRAVEQVRALMAQGQTRLASLAQQRARAQNPDWHLPPADFQALVMALEREQSYVELLPLMVDFLRHFPERQTRMRLKLAQLLIFRMNRPAQALAVLAKLPREPLEADLESVRRKLITAAQRAKEAEDHMEIAVEDW